MASRGCVIFVGNLPGDVREREVEDLFIKVDVLPDHCKVALSKMTFALDTYVVQSFIGDASASCM